MLPSSWSNFHESLAQSGWSTDSFNLGKRSHLDMNENQNIHRLSHEQIYTLHVVSVALSATSLGAALVTSSWFYRMRRSFRHDLIMLLIHCDIFKSVWFLAFPAVELVYGTVKPETAFCQASGFFLAVSIEASDIAVAMIAIHTALYIFRGEHGLYPYRKIAYAFFVICPLLLASLAFINDPGYVNTGNFCYLPIDPVWTRRALSWIPRYLAFALIFLTYLAIYIYVRILMRNFSKMSKKQRKESVSLLESNGSSIEQPHYMSPTPPIAHHGPFPSTTTSNRTSRDGRGRQYSVISTISTTNMEMSGTRYTSKYTSKSPRKLESSVNWRIPNFSLEKPRSHKSPLDSETDLGDPIADELTTPSEAHLMNSRSSPASSKSPTPPGTQNYSVAETSTAMPSRAPSLPQILSAAMRPLALSSRSSETRSSVIQALTPLDADGMIKTREKIRRQLRQLFIYPLVYVIVWILPFIVHLTSYGKGAPFGMVAASLVFLSLQGLADAIVFSLKESPWRHPERKRPCVLCFWRRDCVQEAANSGVGRTREEMRLDGRNARERRDAELRARRAEPPVDRKPAPEWWDYDHGDNA